MVFVVVVITVIILVTMVRELLSVVVVVAGVVLGTVLFSFVGALYINQRKIKVFVLLLLSCLCLLVIVVSWMVVVLVLGIFFWLMGLMAVVLVLAFMIKIVWCATEMVQNYTHGFSMFVKVVLGLLDCTNYHNHKYHQTPPPPNLQ